MKEKYISLVFLCITLPVFLFGQKYAPIEDPDMLKHMESSLLEAHPHIFDQVSIDSLIAIDEDHAMVFYSADQSHYETIVNSGRKDMALLETSKFISRHNIPDIIKASFDASEFGAWDIKRQYSVKRPGSGQLYRLDIQNPNNNIVKTVYYNHTGHPVKSPL